MLGRHSWTWLSASLTAALIGGCATTGTAAKSTAQAAQPATGATATAATQPASTTAAPAAGSAYNDDWARIKAGGTITVGVSLALPPFGFYNADFVADGFDVALMREVGKRLGLKVAFKDFAFDGVLGALQLRQVDAAIAAIVITPNRLAQVGFSDAYYAGDDAILATADSTATVRIAGDLAGKKIGVQAGTVYADWLRDALVLKNLSSADKVLPYSQTSAAIRDLKAKKLDFVVTSLLPAQAFVTEGGVKLVGQGLNRQLFGIAARRDSTELLAQINTALAAIRADHTFDALTSKYLNVPEAVVLPVLTPSAIPAPGSVVTAGTIVTAGAIVCIDGLSFVSDLSLPDQNMTAPPVLKRGQSFTKSWRVRNSGTCAWAADYALTYSFGNTPLAQMGGTHVVVGAIVQPGATADLSANLVAPTVDGTYQGVWTMRNSAGLAFGESLWSGLTVSNTLTPTVAAAGAAVSAGS